LFGNKDLAGEAFSVTTSPADSTDYVF